MSDVKTTAESEGENEELDGQIPDSENLGGRPLKYKTPQELDAAVQAYFDLCDPHVEKRLVDGGMNQKGETIWVPREVLTEQKPYTMSGLARAIGLTRQSLLNYKERDGFFDSIQSAKARCEEYAESQLFGPYANGAKFNLNNNYQGEYRPWAERQEVDHTSKGKGFFGTSKLEISVVEDPKTEDQPDTEDSA